MRLIDIIDKYSEYDIEYKKRVIIVHKTITVVDFIRLRADLVISGIKYKDIIVDGGGRYIRC